MPKPPPLSTVEKELSEKLYDLIEESKKKFVDPGLFVAGLLIVAAETSVKVNMPEDQLFKLVQLYRKHAVERALTR